MRCLDTSAQALSLNAQNHLIIAIACRNKGKRVDLSGELGVVCGQRKIDLGKFAVTGLVGERSILAALAAKHLNVDLGCDIFSGKNKGFSFGKDSAVFGNDGIRTVS